MGEEQADEPQDRDGKLPPWLEDLRAEAKVKPDGQFVCLGREHFLDLLGLAEAGLHIQMPTDAEFRAAFARLNSLEARTYALTQQMADQFAAGLCTPLEVLATVPRAVLLAQSRKIEQAVRHVEPFVLRFDGPNGVLWHPDADTQEG